MVVETKTGDAKAGGSAGASETSIGADLDTGTTSTSTSDTTKTTGDAAKAAAEAKAAADKAAADKGAAFDLKLPKGFDPKDPLLSKITATAKAKGVNGEQLQALLDDYLGDIGGAVEAETQRLAAQRADWGKALRADPEFGGDKLPAAVAGANAAVTKFGGTELHQLLRESGFGNHPAVVRTFARINAALAEASSAGTSGDRTTTPTREEALRARYPNTKGI